jgi:hypothetical protein
MQDLKVIAIVDDQLFPSTWPNPAFVESTYNLVQRIYMCLVTQPGDVEDDPAYGAGLRGALLGIPGQQVDRARAAVSAVLQKCKADLQGNLSSDPSEQLVDLRLESLEYDIDVTAWRVGVTIVSGAAQTTLTVAG